jgi:hypothetical protein
MACGMFGTDEPTVRGRFLSDIKVFAESDGPPSLVPRRTTDADPHFVVSEIDPFAKIERGRIAEPYHLSIATDQLRSEFVRRKRQQLVPFADERPARELIGLTRARDLCLSTKAGSRRICRAISRCMISFAVSPTTP